MGRDLKILCIDDGKSIKQFSVKVQIGPGVQPIQMPGKEDFIEGTPMERFYEIVRRGLREAQWHYLYQVLNHVFDGLVTWSGHMGDPVMVPQIYNMQTDPDACKARSGPAHHMSK